LTSRRRGGYRSFQATGQAEDERTLALVASGQQCPGCGHVFRGVFSPEDLPERLVQRGRDSLSLRSLDLEPTARRLAEHLRERIGVASFARWIGTLRLVDSADGTLFFAASPEVVGWVRRRFLGLLGDTASELAGRPLACRVVAMNVDARTLGDLVAECEASEVAG
jgi:hypothetical protein